MSIFSAAELKADRLWKVAMELLDDLEAMKYNNYPKYMIGCPKCIEECRVWPLEEVEGDPDVLFCRFHGELLIEDLFEPRRQ